MSHVPSFTPGGKFLLPCHSTAITILRICNQYITNFIQCMQNVVAISSCIHSYDNRIIGAEFLSFLSRNILSKSKSLIDICTNCMKFESDCEKNLLLTLDIKSMHTVITRTKRFYEYTYRRALHFQEQLNLTYSNELVELVLSSFARSASSLLFKCLQDV